MNQKKKTAVAWLREQLVIPAPAATTDWLFAKALEMERKQIEQAFEESRLTHPMIGFKHDTFNAYFTDTYQTEP